MMTTGHVVSMYLTTSGLTGPQLGSDEKEIILLVYAVIDPNSSEVCSEQCCWNCPALAVANSNCVCYNVANEDIACAFPR